MKELILNRPKRSFLPEELKIDSWENLEPFFKNLADRNIESEEDLKKWLADRSEMDAIISEDAGWRYIKMSINTNDEGALKAYQDFVKDIRPKIAPYEDAFNKKLSACPFLDSYQEIGADIYFRSVNKAIELFRQDNVPLFAQISEESQQFGAISGAQTIEHKGDTHTMQSAATFLQSQNRKEREDVYRAIQTRRTQDKESLDSLLTSLIDKRHQVAVNAGFKNYRDYKFEDLGRFDYSIDDCLNFHESIATEIPPMARKNQEERRQKLNLDKLRPWDTEVDLSGKSALKPFENGAELIQGCIELFDTIKPVYGDYLRTMREMKHLDLESKEGKMPGGYNYPLYEIGVPFIFMNSVGSHRDLITMIHEGGHAIHSFLSRDLELTAYKSLPSEVAELASMSMELISMEHWDVIYKDADDLKRAKKEHLEKLLSILPWIATVDAFQHWLYVNHDHSIEERETAWTELMTRFGTGMVDYTGFEEVRKNVWQRQLHIFEVPFYYIEYGMAQLGAIAVWRNYKNDPEKALLQYENALKLGYTKSIPEIYSTAGIEFNFSQEYVRDLMAFVNKEIEAL